jgi:hypothetical protein
MYSVFLGFINYFSRNWAPSNMSESYNTIEKAKQLDLELEGLSNHREDTRIFYNAESLEEARAISAKAEELTFKYLPSYNEGKHPFPIKKLDW